MTERKFKATIVYIGSHQGLRDVSRDALTSAGYRLIPCANISAAREALLQHPCHGCIVDAMFSKPDGFSVAKQIRQVIHQLPILFLLDASPKEDAVAKLKLAGDDYIVKPFRNEELLGKIAHLFRQRFAQPEFSSSSRLLVAVGRYVFDQARQQLIYQDEARKLTHRESQLLGYLIEHRNQVVKREAILTALWGEDDYFTGRSLDVFISRLRKYLQQDPDILVENIHGVGFRLLVSS